MFQRIVVPLDGSALAERALEWATDLARVAKVPIHLVRVIDLGRIGGGGSLVWGLSPWALQRALDEEQQASLAYLDRVSQEIKDHGLETSVEVRHGNTPDEIVASVTEDDLVVMATHGRGGVPRWYFGSVAESVVRHAPGPVMLIRVLPAERAEIAVGSEKTVRAGEMAVAS